MGRKAGELIQQLLLPNSQKVRTSGSPYFYGMDEGTWRGYMDEYHDYVQRGGDSKRVMVENIEDDLGLSPAEAESFYRYSRNPENTVSRHVALGVPHAYASEDLIKTGLIASGNPAAFLHSDNHFATDLQVALGKLTQNVDVQNRFLYNKGPQQDTFAALNNLERGLGQRIYDEASAKETLENIIGRAQDMSGRPVLDKLLQSRDRAVRPDEVKDALIGSVYNVRDIRNLASRPNQGYYDVTRPLDMYETDLNKLRSTLLPMSKGEFESMGGSITRTPRFEKKLQLMLPTQRVVEMATPDRPYINDEVRQMLIQP